MDDGKKEKSLKKEDIVCPDGWLWKGEWTKDMGRAVDEDGGLQIEPAGHI